MDMLSARHRSPFSIAWRICLVALLLAGCSSKEEKVSKFIDRGDKLLAAGDTTKAVLEYKNAVQIDPKNGKARLALGKGYLAQKDIRQAYQAFLAATEQDPNLDEARMEVVGILTAAAMGQEALDQLSKMVKPENFQPRVDILKTKALVALKKHPEAIELLRGVKDGNTNTDVQALLTICFRETKDFQAMEGAALRWRGLDPKSPSPYLVLAQHAARQGDKKRAMSELETLVKANEGNNGMALLRAQVLNELGMNEEAERAFEQLPNEPNLVKARAEFHLKHGREAKARQGIEELISAHPNDADAVIWLSRILVPKGELDEAIGRFDNILKLELEPADRQKIMLAKASVLADQKKVDEAKKLTDDVLKQNQGNLDAHYLMGNLLLGTGKSEEAEIHLNQVAVGRPENPNAHQLLARSQYLNKKDAMALETLKNGVKAVPNSIELRMDLVRAHLVSKEADQAVRVLSDGLAIKADELVLLKARGEVFTATKDYAKAETDFRKMVDLQPKIPAGYLQMGQLMLAQSKMDQAVEWYKKAMDAENGWQQALPALLTVYLSKNDTKAAVTLAEAEAGKRADAPAVHFLLGQVHLKAGNFGKAEGPFVKAIQLAPEWIEPYRGLVEAYRKGGKGDKIAAKVEELHKAKPTASATLILATLLEDKGKLDEATKLYRDLIAKSKDSPSVMNDIAFLLAERRSDPKDLALASDLAGKALEKQPENPAFLDTVAWIAYKRGKLDDAWQQLQLALLKQPDLTTLNYHSAIVAHARGDKKIAMEHLEKVLQQKTDAATQEAALKLKKEWEG